jgi:Fe-S cluster biosynthesis and repair protein YggX
LIPNIGTVIQESFSDADLLPLLERIPREKLPDLIGGENIWTMIHRHTFVKSSIYALSVLEEKRTNPMNQRHRQLLWAAVAKDDYQLQPAGELTLLTYIWPKYKDRIWALGQIQVGDLEVHSLDYHLVISLIEDAIGCGV